MSPSPKTLAAVLLAAAAFPSQAPAASPPTGIFTGEAVHHFDDGVEYRTRVVLQAYKKNGAVRLVGVTLGVRMQCPDRQAIQDRSVFKTWFDGPRIAGDGSFRYKTGGIVLKGRIGRSGASGTLSASEPGCAVSGVPWTASKRKGS